MSKMWQISLLILVIGITAVTALPVNPAELNTVDLDLVITGYQSLGNVYIDGQAQLLTNGRNWSLTDHIALSSMSRLIALVGLISSGEPSCAGVLASVNDTYLLTNSSWKCSTFSSTGWTELGYDDSWWSNAVEYGSNGNHSTCTQQMHFDDISSNSKWIWSNNVNVLAAYCRGYLPLCQTSSPCLNGGTCLPNHTKMCNCPPEFTGTYCDSQIFETLETSEMTTEVTTIEETTHSETTESINTSNLHSTDPQTTEVTIFPQTTQELMDRVLVITAYQDMQLMYIDGEEQTLINGNMWNQTDRAALTETNRLVAVKVLGDETCGGILASVGDTYFLTNAEWKCSPYNFGNWYILGFDDSQEYWFNAAEFGSNADGHTHCSYLQDVPDIRANAMWIWVPDQTEKTIYCRGYMPVCDNSPCLNNGTCLQNNVKICSCLPQFTGTYCETDQAQRGFGRNNSRK